MTFEMKKFSVAGSTGFMVATAIATLFMSDAAMAQQCKDGADDQALECGTDANANGVGAAAVGTGANANGVYATSTGTISSATGNGATAVGGASEADGDNATALGFEAGATGEGAIAVGALSEAILGGTAVGYDSFATLGGLAVGTQAIAGETGAVALGSNTEASHVNSVALGAGSVTSDPNTVSVGSVQIQRRITNVADGIFANDVATVGQLNVVQDLAIQNFQAIGGLQDGIDANTQSILFVAGFVADNTAAIEDLQFANAVQDVAIAETQMAITGLVEVNAQQDAQIAENSEAIGKIGVQVEANSFDIAANTAAIGNNAAAITVNAADIAENAGDILTAFQAIENNAAMITSNSQRLDLVEESVFSLNQTVARLDEEIDGSTAVAIAMSGNAFLPDRRFNLTANIGTYEGAVAGSLQLGVMVRDNVAFNAGIATGFNKGGGTGGRVGLTFGF